MKGDQYGNLAFEEIVNCLWENKSQTEEEHYVFDYSTYGGLPGRISRQLRSDAVDVIQEFYQKYNISGMNKRQFRKGLKEALFLLA